MCVIHGFAFSVTSRKRKPQHVVQAFAQRGICVPSSLGYACAELGVLVLKSAAEIRVNRLGWECLGPLEPAAFGVCSWCLTHGFVAW